MTPAVLGGLLFVGLGLVVGVYGLLAPAPPKVSIHRLQPGLPPKPSVTSRASGLVMGSIDRLLRRRGGSPMAATLERAGVTMPVEKVVLVIGAVVLGGAVCGYAMGGPLLGVCGIVVVLVLTRMNFNRLASRRQRMFADQLDDSLQLMASSLRAGHSLLQALDSVSHEAEEPTAAEFSRIVNETRVGRDLGGALEETSARMGSEDFLWIAQAIQINREVGGDLAEVLDQVADTIRDRNKIRRQVKALSAEGKLSAYVLMALPIGVVGFLFVSNPTYLKKLTASPAGFAIIGVALVLMAVGGAWLRKVVSFKF